jgi:hypothetical protein
MKRSLLLPLLLLASGIFAQQKLSATSEKSLPPIDPTKIVQGLPADTEAPVVNCLNGLSVNIMPTGLIQLWASDFLLSVSDNMTPVGQLKLGIRKAGTGFGFPVDSLGNLIQSVQFDCDELGVKAVELWAVDESWNAASCNTFIFVQDNIGNCPNSNNVDLNLCAKVLCSGEMIEKVVFELHGSVNFAPPFSYFDATDTHGCLELVNNIPIASTFTITPSKDDNPLNGLDEQDMILLSKHIHGTQPFTEPWQWVAADANRDGQITIADSLEFRNLLLGIYTELPNNSSWRFVPEGYQFPSPDPLALPLPESVTIASVLANMDTIFMGIKIGDLDCSALPGFTEHANGERNKVLVSEHAEISQPRPNPTTSWTVLPIYLPFAEQIHLEISDIGGKICWSNDLQLEKGNHNLEIPASAMPSDGVYLWRVSAGKFVKAGKLVRL